jgi:hypothetical protein
MIPFAKRDANPVPAVWRIDVEPDEFQPGVAATTWSGFEASVRLVDQMRAALSRATAGPFRPTWFFRLDPDIKRCFGRADYVLVRHRELVHRLRDQGDPLGIHVHPYRWNEDRSVAYSDHSDEEWVVHCLRSSARVFLEALGEPPRRASYGGYFWSEALLDASERLGIKVDLTPEPGLPPKDKDPSFGDYATAPSPDYTDCPRQPYFPDRANMFAIGAAPHSRRALKAIPLSAFDYRSAQLPLKSRLKMKLRPQRVKRRHLPLSLWKAWPSSKAFWDYAEQAISEQPVPYCAFAMRSDPEDSETFQRARALLEYLPRHRIARRLHFDDPLGPGFSSLC